MYGLPRYLWDSSWMSSGPPSSLTVAVPRISTYSKGLSGSKPTIEARGSRRRLVAFRRPSTVDTSTSSPSRLTHTTLDCGPPSGLTVVITTNVGASSSAFALSDSATGTGPP